MNNKYLLIIVVLLGIIYIGIRSFKKETSFFSDTNIYIRVKDQGTDLIDNMNLEKYLIGVVAAEMPASFSEEALKAQAVAARTYAIYKIKKRKNEEYDVTTTRDTQVFITPEQMQSKWGQEYEYYLNKITTAVESTEKEVLLFDNKIIPAYYFSMSNGYTESSMSVFKENYEFLQPVISNEDTTHQGYKVTTFFSNKEIEEKLGIQTPITVENEIKNVSNRVDQITINNKIFSGIEIRSLLGLRSTDFEFLLEPDGISITTYGYGHGVGMSQYGANTLAKQGKKYEEILKYYYTGVELKKINSINNQ